MIFVNFLVIFVVLFVLTAFVGDRIYRSQGYKGPVSDHFDGKKFFNLDHTGVPVAVADFKSLIKWFRTRARMPWHHRPPVLFAKPRTKVLGSELVITYINHSTVLIQTQGLNILTDPVWSKRVSPFKHMGPARFRQPGMTLNDLPPIDIVLLSHNHYDHLDLPTLKEIYLKWQSKIYTSLGNAGYLAKKGIFGALDMDWWDESEYSSQLTIAAVPAQHFSARALSDRNTSLWCGFVLKFPDTAPVYFVGDTGYGHFITKIAEKYPDGFRLALIPIGAYKPEWFMGPAHMGPSQAVQMYKELKVQTAVAIHFGTFHLADDGQDEPVHELEKIILAAQHPVPHFMALQNGESVAIK